MSNSINIQKAEFSLPVILIQHCNIAKIHSELSARVPVENEELSSLPCVLSIDSEVIDPTFLAQLLELLRQFNFIPVGLKTDRQSLMEQAVYAGLAIFNNKLNQQDLFNPNLNNQDTIVDSMTKAPIIHHGNVSSEEQIYAEGSDLVVLGDVEKGAEVIADGNIYIGGTLTGKAYAGNSGVKNAGDICVRAYQFEPELVSVAGFYQIAEDIPISYKGLAVKVGFDLSKLTYCLE